MQQLNLKNGSILLLIILHTVGIIGLNSKYNELFLMLTPFNLLISFIVVFINQEGKNKNFILFCMILFTAGFGVEVIGVKTGMLFGGYTYGKTLGIKLLDVPLIIGINWLILVYAVGNILHALKRNIIIKSLIGAALLTFLDVLIEPVAIRFDFWHWNNNNIPLQNYIAWFIISFFFLLFFNKFSFHKNNFPAKVLYITELLFFAALNLV